MPYVDFELDNEKKEMNCIKSFTKTATTTTTAAQTSYLKKATNDYERNALNETKEIPSELFSK